MFVKMTKEQVKEKINYIKSYAGSINAATASDIDPNANITSKNVATLMPDLFKDFNVQLKRALISEKISIMFGKEVADYYNKQIENHEIYIHDESHPLFPYCCSISMYPFFLNGLKDLGGDAKAPKHLDSYCGGFINLVFCLASQFAGACLYKDQKVIVDGKTTAIKDFVSSYALNKTFENGGSVWEYADISSDNHFIAEDGKQVKLKKVYRRKYSDKIYEITTKTGLKVKVSKDHKFKLLYRGRDFEVKSEDLQVGDTIYANTDFSYLVDKSSVDYKIGQLIGIFAGDGNIHGNSLRVSVNPNQQFIMDFLDENLKLIGIETVGTRQYDKRGSGCYSYYVGSTKSAKIVQSYFKKDCYTTYTKDVDLSDKSLSWKLGFLDGLMVTDGCFSKAHFASITLTNESLIKLVKEILGDLSISKNYTSFTPKKENRSTLYKIGVPLKVMKYLSLTVKKPTCSSLLKYKSYKKHIEPQDELYYIGTNACKTVKSCVTTTANGHRIDSHIRSDVIVDIKTFTNDDSYVYEVETESHWYNCGGLITHNCATVEWLMGFDYFARKDFGDNYLETHKDFILDKFQQVVYSLNQPAGARSYQCPFWNISIFDKYFFDGLFSDFCFPDEDLSKPNWETLEKLQNCFMEWFNEERTRSLLTFPVVTAATLTDLGKCKDGDFNKMLCHEMSLGNSFFNYMSNSVDSLSSCCRLRNALTDNTFSFSLGAGGVMAGSVNVITLNFNRLVQNAKREGVEIEDKLKEQLSYFYKYQVATRSYFKDLQSVGMLPAYDAGFIALEKQYLTLGINGMLEAAEFLGMTAGNNEPYKNFLKKYLKIIYDCNKAARAEYGIMFNTEFVPAENLGVKNYAWDKKDGYVVNPKRNCYNSYFYPSEATEEEVNIVDKFVLHGSEITQYLDGGSALHLNLAEYPTEEGYKRLFELAAKTGCNYWTTNIAVTCCEDCGYIDKRTLHHCSKCGSKKVSWATRIIGYLRKVTSFSEQRQLEERMRFYSKAPFTPSLKVISNEGNQKAS